MHHCFAGLLAGLGLMLDWTAFALMLLPAANTLPDWLRDAWHGLGSSLAERLVLTPPRLPDGLQQMLSSTARQLREVAAWADAAGGSGAGLAALVIPG